jgi:K+-sensing histidine kinase KdpD
MVSADRNDKVEQYRETQNRFLGNLRGHLHWFDNGSRRKILSLLLSVAAVGLATLFRLALDPILGSHHPFTLYFAAVAVASWYGGFVPGIVATILAYFAADWFFITPRFEFNWPHSDLDEFIALLAFLFSCSAIAVTSNVMRQALDRAHRKQQELEREILDRQRAEQALQEAQVQLRQYADLLEDRVQERTAHLQETIQSLQGVCYHLAHDLRAPLRAMEGYSHILCQEYASRFDAAGGRYVQSISEAAQRMDLLIHGLIEFGRLGHQDFTLKTLDLEPVVERVLELFKTEIAAKRAIVKRGDWWPEVCGNESLVEIVILNLVSNALKFVPPGVSPQVELWAEQRENKIRIWVADKGIGLPPELKHQVFWIFQRLHPSAGYPGTGMGLAIANKAVERMSGRLGVETAPGQGSRFWSELPVPAVKSFERTESLLAVSQPSL